MNIKKLILDLILVFAVSFITVKLFAPKPVDNTVIWADTDTKVEEHTARIQEMEQTLTNYNTQLKDIKQEIDAKEPQIIQVRTNRTASNPLVSAMSSSELTQLLAKRYQDSTKVKP
jgi:septal ring factor EnvC (AmiA/AmiB activator)